MAKGTIIFFFILTTVASLLLGINIGKNLAKTQSAQIPAATPTFVPTPTTPISPTTASPSAEAKKSSGTTTFSDGNCGFSFSYPGSFIRQKSVNSQSTILTDPDDPRSMIAATCAVSIPRPPVSSDKIESITLGGVAATVYHDQTDEGSPRDEVIVKHPTNGMEIILAGYGETFQQVLSSFKFRE